LIDTTLSHFRITAKLGEGGMGEVYRAEDTKLGRDVAIKVLPEAVAQDPERLARFQREAKVLAALNHPNIAAIYSLESAVPPAAPEARLAPQEESEAALSERPEQPLHFLVMELVDGATLQELIEQGVPRDQAIEMAAQVAEALEEAHNQGIVHRDLKPANVKVTPDGKVKVLDFGLAKALDPTTVDTTVTGTNQDRNQSPPALSMSPTLTAQMTQAGVLLGTAAYMSPEQARGQEAGKQADIWAFGVVLWEMLSGRRLFAGPTVSDTLAEVLKTDPDLDALPAGTPASVHRLLRRCLERDPKQRLRDIGDARLELAEAHLEDTPETGELHQSAPPRWREYLAWTLAIVGLAIAAFLAFRSPAPETEVFPTTRFDITLPDDHQLAYLDEVILTLSPDGRTLAFVAVHPESKEQMVFTRSFQESAFRPVLGTERGSSPTFSPDGDSLLFFSGGQLKRISADGGHAVSLTEISNPRGAVWSPDDTIYYSPGYVDGIWKIPASGGSPESVIEPDKEAGERTYRWPDLLPDNRTLIYTVGTDRNPNNYDDAYINAYSLDTGESRVLLERASMARFVQPNHIAFARRGVLYLATIDLNTLEVAPDPPPVLEELGGDPSSGVSYFDVSPNGTLAFVSGSVSDTRAHLTVVDSAGEAARLPLEPQSFHHPRFSPDGSKIAVTIGTGAAGTNGDVWVYDLETESMNRMSFGSTDLYASFTPDGKWLAFSHAEGELGIYRIPADGSGSPELISPAGLDGPLTESWTPDGSMLAFTLIGPNPTVYLMEPMQEPVISCQRYELCICPTARGRRQVASLSRVGRVPALVRRWPQALLPGHRQPEPPRDGGRHSPW
jgi:serine/threonine protein kinase